MKLLIFFLQTYFPKFWHKGRESDSELRPIDLQEKVANHFSKSISFHRAPLFKAIWNTLPLSKSAQIGERYGPSLGLRNRAVIAP